MTLVTFETMKFYVVLFAALVATSSFALANVPAGILTEHEIELQFKQFKYNFARNYRTQSEELYRKAIFRENLKFIHRHNFEQFNGYHGFRVGINNFTDMTNFEFRQFFLVEMPVLKGTETYVKPDESLGDLPASVDWVAKGAVTPVINQGQCGSSWAIPLVAAIEGGHAIKSGQLEALSIQQLIDCCAQDGSGCNGGIIDDGYSCVIKMGGLDTAASYPLNPDGFGACKFNKNTIGSKIDGYVDLGKTESNLQSAVALVGPIAAAIDASQQSFQFYQSGVYYEPGCSQTPDHGVTIVGYGTDNGDAFWKVKNSWGTSWGEQGYIRMARNKNNMCGIANLASYPLVIV